MTCWTDLARLKNGTEDQRRQSMTDLFLRYRDPIRGFLLRKGYVHERAEDLVQDFFLYSIEHELFEAADSNRGRFRSLVLSALQHYAQNVHRRDSTQRRSPAGGFAGEDVADLPEGAVPADHDTPERAFLRHWAATLVQRVLVTLQVEYAVPERQMHYEILRRLIIAPLMEGAEAPPQRALAAELGLTEKEVANRLITARRAYQRLLRAEIAAYAGSEEEVAQEIQEIFAALGNV